MNCEFLLICAGIALIMVLLIVILFMQIRLLRRFRKTEQESIRHTSSPEPQQAGTPVGIVHCRGCGERMDSAQRVCPKCGITRT